MIITFLYGRNYLKYNHWVIQYYSYYFDIQIKIYVIYLQGYYYVGVF